MRIAVLYWARRKIGGTEAYLESIILELLAAGHQVAFWHEVDGPGANERISLPEGVPAWCVADLGAESALAVLRSWSPDIIFTHCLMNLKLEAETLKIAPAVFFAHAYYGTCISGNKSFRRPIAAPCHRRFGWQCLVNYYPHRCGGLSPFTMAKEYRRQSKRLEQLQGYRVIVTHSSYMRDEYIKHGFEPKRVHRLVGYADQRSSLAGGEGMKEVFEHLGGSLLPAAIAEGLGSGVRTAPRVRLLFLGRMDRLKGGDLLIDALPYVFEALDRPLSVTFAGDGPMRKNWEEQAARVQAQLPGIQIHFTGWVDENERESLWATCDLLVVPSVWPEPFGLVGPEAGLRGIPIAAFAVGGIPDWLSDNVNGCLAPGTPPTSEGLAKAISRCLCNSYTYARLRRGSIAMAQRFNVENHLTSLLEVFQQALMFQSKW